MKKLFFGKKEKWKILSWFGFTWLKKIHNQDSSFLGAIFLNVWVSIFYKMITIYVHLFL